MRDELLQAVDGAEHAVHALVAFGRHAGIVRMAGHADLVLVGDRNHAIEEVGDALPERRRRRRAGARERRSRGARPSGCQVL